MLERVGKEREGEGREKMKRKKKGKLRLRLVFEVKSGAGIRGWNGG